MSGVIDWKLAEATATRLAPAGPAIDPSEARALVTGLRRAAEDAVEPVALTSGMAAPTDSAETVVVDRHAWVRSNIDGFRHGIGPLLDRAAAAHETPAVVTAVGSRVTAVQLGMAVAEELELIVRMVMVAVVAVRVLREVLEVLEEKE